MITRVEVSDYRSCLNCSFDLQPHLSVLIGPNSSGKTNILKALLLLKKLTGGERLYRYEEEELTGKSKLKVYFNIDGKKVILKAIVETYTDENNNDVVVTSRQEWYMKDVTGNTKRLKIPLFYASEYHKKRSSFQRRIIMSEEKYYYMRRTGFSAPESARKVLAKIAMFASEMRYYSASQFTNPGNCPISFEIEKEGAKRRGLRLYGHTKFLFDLYTEFKANSHEYKQFFDIIGPNGIGLINEICFNEMVTSTVDYSVKSGGRIRKRTREKILVVPQFTIGNNKLSPNQLSEGTFKTITLLFYLVTEASSILLVEEPEVCVHHGLLSSIIELIKTYSHDKQILLSTHSDFVLDHVPPENVYKVSYTPKEETTITHITKSMSKRELEALKNYLETEGNLGEYWKHGALET
jgi:predicted ATP-binding protein involved in virulence